VPGRGGSAAARGRVAATAPMDAEQGGSGGSSGDSSGGSSSTEGRGPQAGRGGGSRARGADRKAAKRAAKEQARLRRAGLAGEDDSRKACTACGKLVDVLVRCQADATGRWQMLCGRCWLVASGGRVDGTAATPHYRRVAPPGRATARIPEAGRHAALLRPTPPSRAARPTSRSPPTGSARSQAPTSVPTLSFPRRPPLRYGGLWKNHHAPISGRRRVPKSASSPSGGPAAAGPSAGPSGTRGDPAAQAAGPSAAREQPPSARELDARGDVERLLLAEAAACAADGRPPA
jgi:hypothetical protein